MSEAETIEPSRRRGRLSVVAGRATIEAGKPRAAPSETRPAVPLVSFDRRELRMLLDLYGAKVAAGEWRDYAIDFSAARAVFSVFRRASEAPLYRIEKNPDLARRQGAYRVVAAGGLVLRRGHDLPRVIAVLRKTLELVRSE